MNQLPNELRELLKILPQLPNSSAVAQYPPGFPIEVLPSHLQQDAEHFAWSCWNLLNALDADTASRWHWRDIRKVRRQIELSLPSLFSHKTAPPSPKSDGDISASDPRHRYRVLLFWLTCQKEVLDKRLDGRVDTMVNVSMLFILIGIAHASRQNGLLDEVKQLYQTQKETDVEVDYTRGICQAIGYKPFATYLQQPSPSSKDFEAAIEQTKIQTRQYAKRQIGWFQRKLLPAMRQLQQSGQRDVQVYVLDATDAERFESDVEGKASQLLHCS